jgi:hypothetical protein
LAPTHYADINQHKKDMRRLAQLFRNIRQIRIMGGEPLLHPDVDLFIISTRSAFPRCELRFVTNGMLLLESSQKLWDACRNTKAIIDLSVYPPLKRYLPEIRALCNSEGVKLNEMPVETFIAHHNLKGDSDKHKALEVCREAFFCPFLKDGHLYVCAVPALVHHFNNAFDSNIIADEGIDIYSKHVSGRAVLKQLNRPVETCKWCSYNFSQFPWETTNKLADDWEA